jgi:tetratricopeptide (TPR) repeat protein
MSSIDSGLDTERALALARDFLAELRAGNLKPSEVVLDDAVLDVLHAAVELIAGADSNDVAGALEDASRLHAFVSAAPWAEPDFDEKAELLRACSLWAWRLARRAGKASVSEKWFRRAGAGREADAGLMNAFSVDPISLPVNERATRGAEFGLDDPEVLLALCALLRDQWETRPDGVRQDSEFLYNFIERPKRKIGLFDEREYFLGELALIAGTSCRVLSRRDQARRWFGRSEAAFGNTMNAVADWARLSYQRLALGAEERRFEEVMELLPALMETFGKLGMAEDALKCRFLEGAVLRETDRLDEARDLYLGICREAEGIGQERLLAVGSYNLVQVYSLQGLAQEAIAESRRALPALRRQENRIGIAKLQWGLACLLRESGKPFEAIETFRASQQEFSEIGMHADVAAIQLVVADLLLDRGKHDEAEAQILSALPTIEEYRLVSEGIAALSLLKESVRQKKINREALRDLHGFLEKSVS